MATTSTAAMSDVDRRHSLSVIRLIVATGLTAAVVFIICWLGTAIPFASPTHAYIGLFTNAEASSGRALAEGSCWSFLFGALVGGAFALIYNATAALDRK